MGLDTNILIRILTRDDPRQAASARRFLDANISADEPAFVNRVVLIEIVWVLESAYDEYGRGEIAAVIEGILETAEFLVEDAVEMRGAIARYRAGADFADATLAATNSSQGCTVTASFDRAACKKLEHFRFIS